jgi:hypothetical protein
MTFRELNTLFPGSAYRLPLLYVSPGLVSNRIGPLPIRLAWVSFTDIVGRNSVRAAGYAELLPDALRSVHMML